MGGGAEGGEEPPPLFKYHPPQPELKTGEGRGGEGEGVSTERRVVLYKRVETRRQLVLCVAMSPRASDCPESEAQSKLTHRTRPGF